ncbi:hypothetical protein [Pasteuria penetrans]|uniref:hypothetical protein n=1 Tax=Pasteuria penetrans TaxID=86005 RepID=UPI000FACB735|nr:hypothetical protein [Pasteuria penetrans]
MQDRLLSTVGTNQPSDVELVFILLGLFFTEYASLYRKRYSGYHNTIGRPCIHILIPLIFDIIKEFLRCSNRMLIIQIPREGPLFEALGGTKGRPLMGERTLYESRNRPDVYEETEGYKVKEQFYSDFTQFLMGIMNMDPSFYRMDSTLIDSFIRKRVLRTTDQSYSTAEQRDKMEQPGYKEKGNRRAAVEGVCSSMKNRFQAAKMKVHGKTRVARAMMAKGSAYH